jgi:DNA-binding response OmpR family regulator
MSAPKILLVEDDPAMQQGLADNLELEGYVVLIAGSVRDGKRLALKEQPDLVLLDLMLPDGDGMTLCRQLRSHGFRKAIIMLTARSEEADTVLGLEVGADDYVVKPFSLRQLLARISAHLRREGRVASSPARIRVGLAEVDFSRHQLWRDGLPVEVSAKELELLRYLVSRRGTVVSREEILTAVWHHQREIITRTVDNFIVRLRKKIEADPATPRYLVTVHGSGYKLVEE